MERLERVRGQNEKKIRNNQNRMVYEGRCRAGYENVGPATSFAAGGRKRTELKIFGIGNLTDANGLVKVSKANGAALGTIRKALTMLQLHSYVTYVALLLCTATALA